MEKRLRWERRKDRRKRHSAQRVQGELFGFQIILLIAISVAWILGARFLTVFAVITTECPSDLPAFGNATTGSGAFEGFVIICALLAVLWLASALVYFKLIVTRWSAASFHLILGVMIAMLAAHFYIMANPTIIKGMEALC